MTHNHIAVAIAIGTPRLFYHTDSILSLHSLLHRTHIYDPEHLW